jgi:hypothetical protein
MPEWLKIVIPGLFGLLTAILAASLSAYWSVNRIYREKWWERKEKAYVEIIDSLCDIVIYCDLLIRELETGYDQDNLKKKELSDKYADSSWKIERITHIGAFVISKDIANVLEELRQRPTHNRNETSLLDAVEEDVKYFRQALLEIRSLARKDLRVK